MTTRLHSADNSNNQQQLHRTNSLTIYHFPLTLHILLRRNRAQASIIIIIIIIITIIIRG
jgi:hypothetical protein